VVVDRDGELLLRRLLADDVLVELFFEVLRFGQVIERGASRLGPVILEDRVAHRDALVAQGGDLLGRDLLDGALGDPDAVAHVQQTSREEGDEEQHQASDDADDEHGATSRGAWRVDRPASGAG